MSLNLLFLVNPNAGAVTRANLVADAKHACESQGWRCEIVESPTDLAARTANRDLPYPDACVAFGGDGTVASALNVLPEGVPIAVMPLGTENLLAKHIGATASARALVEQLSGGFVAAFDAISDGKRMFTLMTGIGFDAEVVRRVHARRRGHISKFSYAKPILDTIRTYAYPRLRVRVESPDGQALAWEAAWVFVSNVGRYAGGLRFSPAADPADGVLDVCTFCEGGTFAGLGYLGAVALGRHNRLASVRSERATRVTIESDAPVPYQVDGDPGGETPVALSVIPARLHLIVARRHGERLQLMGSQRWRPFGSGSPQ